MGTKCETCGRVELGPRMSQERTSVRVIEETKNRVFEEAKTKKTKLDGKEQEVRARGVSIYIFFCLFVCCLLVVFVIFNEIKKHVGASQPRSQTASQGLPDHTAPFLPGIKRKVPPPSSSSQSPSSTIVVINLRYFAPCMNKKRLINREQKRSRRNGRKEADLSFSRFPFENHGTALVGCTTKVRPPALPPLSFFLRGGGLVHSVI